MRSGGAALLATLVFFVAGCASPRDAGHTAETLQNTRPNMVLIIADDLGWTDLGPYGNEGIRTPNLDRMAENGMQFDQAILTVSSCSPSRASIITGRYPHNTGAEQLHWPVPAEQLTFVELLRDAGYWTAAGGKWHLGNALKDRFDRVEGYGEDDGSDGYDAAACGCGAWVDLLRERPDGQPFFLWLAASDPHRIYEEGTIPDPHEPETVWVPPYLPDLPEVREDLALYYDEIARLDHLVGDVLDELERQEVADETVVLFISDNGAPFPRAKTTLYDSGIKTPFVVQWPERLPQGVDTDALVSSVDIAPTFLQMAGVPVPASMQGRSLLSVLADPEADGREYAFAERHWHDFDDYARAVRSPRFKYIRNYYNDLPGTPPADAVRSPTFQAMLRLEQAGRLDERFRQSLQVPRPEEELYDLRTDPHEMNNLASDPNHEEALEEMRDVLRRWRDRTDDHLPPRRSPHLYDRETGERIEGREQDMREDLYP